MSRKNYLKLILIFPFLLVALFFILHFVGLFSGGSFFDGSFVGNENRQFEDYTSDLFRQEVSNNAITLHYTLKAPTDYGISKAPLSLGQVNTDTVAMGAAAENALSRLKRYDYDALSEDNKLIYRLLEDTFSSAVAMAPYALYEEPLSPLTGTQAQLPVLLSEYQFYSASDVTVYLDLLKELPEYFQAIADFERAKADAGLFMSYEHAMAVMDECDAFVAMGREHYLYATFEKRVTELVEDAGSAKISGSAGDSGSVGDAGGSVRDAGGSVRDGDWREWIDENDACVRQYVFPAYELLKRELWEICQEVYGEARDVRVADGSVKGLCHFPEGKDYYRLLVREMTGSGRSIVELKGMTLAQIVRDLEDLDSAVEDYSEETPSGDDLDTIFVDSNPMSLLHTLKGKLDGIFPEPPDVDISVKYVDASMEDYMSPAFYLIPAIDNSTDNVIYINPAHMTDELTLFTTLAHEGYPGHLYQTTYFASQNPHPVRSLLGCGGYTEGWATYCEMVSYYFAPVPKTSATLMQKNSSVMLGLYALADMGIHYDGWTLQDTVDFFAKYGITDAAAIAEIYDLIVGDPANYLKYYIGYLEFLELKRDAMKCWGDDFSQKRFHREVLEAGPMPFWMLREELGVE